MIYVFDLKMYLFEREEEKEKKTERVKGVPLPAHSTDGFNSLIWGRLKPGSLPCGWKGAKFFSHLPLCTRCISRE